MPDVVAAFLRRDLLVEASYGAAWLWQAGGALVTLLIFLHVDRLVGGAAAHPLLSPYGGGYFGFVAVGLALSPLLGTGLVTVSDRIRREQVEGTLEYLFAAGPGPLALAAGLAAFDLLFALARSLGTLACAALLFGLKLDPAPLPLLLLLLLAVANAFGISLLSASFVLRHQRGDPFSAGLALAQDFLGGVFFPVELLGPALGAVSAFLPMTHLLAGFRKALFLGPAADVTLEASALALAAALLLPAGALLFTAAVERAKRHGTLAKY